MSIYQEPSIQTSEDEKVIPPAYQINVEVAGVDVGEPQIKPSFFRGTVFQAGVIGICSFLSPGIWVAMNSTGAGGAQSPYLVNAANALVYGIMIFTCALGTTLSNRIGFRWALFVGVLGYAPYAAGLYTNKMFGTIWLVLFGAVTCGISAGIFWSVEGAIVLGYPEASKRGRYLACWLFFKSGGQLLGGSINVALNSKPAGAGSVSGSTYLAFIGLTTISPVFALLLSEPHLVVRDDRTKVTVGTSKLGFKKEVHEVWKVLIRREVLFLMPVAFYSSVMGPWTTTYLALYFSVRARAVASLVTAVIAVIANFIICYFLDYTRISLKIRARSSYIFMAGLSLVAWIWSLIIQIEFSANKQKTMDWTEGGSFSRAYVLYILYSLNTSLIQNVLYFYIGAISIEATDIGRLSSILRSLESVGSTVGYGITSNKKMSHLIPLSIDVFFYGISFPLGWFCINKIGLTLAGGYDPTENLAVVEEEDAGEAKKKTVG